MLPHTENVLEYHKLKTLLSQYAHSALGVSRIEQLSPSTDTDEIRYQLALCSEVKLFYRTAQGFPISGLIDVSTVLKQAAKPGAILDASELLNIGKVAQIAGRVQRAMDKIHPEDYAKLYAVVKQLPTFPKLLDEIERCIAPDGEILDDASPALKSIRKRLANTRISVQSKLESLLQSSTHQKAIQEHVITSRNDRYVIPVKQDLRHTIPGVVQSHSSSGATVFLEPMGVVELNNDLHRLAEEERQEIRRILLSLTDMVRQYLGELTVALRVLGELDFQGAKAKFSLEFNAVEPLLNTNGVVKLHAARHPLLEVNLRKSRTDETETDKPKAPERVVPLDVHLGEKFGILVITGPNTGGKTVALKTTGLLTLMAQSGIHIPAKEGSEIAVFEKVFADIGDEQSIEQNLSTFSSHMTKIIGLLGEVDENSLVLLDEIGAGTDPTEGAALAMAILDWLSERRVRAMVTTHYGALKVYAHTREGLENASMEFDWQTLQPTYRLLIGVPGSSNALKIAQRLGMVESIIENARAYMGKQAVAVEDLIVSIQQSQRELEVERETVQQQIRAAETASKRHENMMAALESERRQIIAQAEAEASEVLKGSRKLVEQAIAEVRRQNASKESVRAAFSAVEQKRREFNERRQKRAEKADVYQRPDVAVGDKVRVKRLDQFGEVLAVSESKTPLTVAVGQMQMRVTYDEIELAPAEDNKRHLSPTILDIQYSKIGSVKLELNLQGKTVEEAREETDKYLDDAYLAGLGRVRIVHGKGTGALRAAVHELLKNHPSVSSFQLAPHNEGGDGATVVMLRET